LQKKTQKSPKPEIIRTAYYEHAYVTAVTVLMIFPILSSRLHIQRQRTTQTDADWQQKNQISHPSMNE